MVSLGRVKFGLLTRLSKEGLESSNVGLELRIENWIK